ncbi:MAG: TspO/MBR family protein [Dokdonella sp.]|uniref:TspO/MBR family protein n=1 Tax=Dokdonella sp. TaxID=2291710 RepID=UPI0032673CBF
MAHPTWQIQALGFLGWLLLCAVAASVGVITSARAASFYKQLLQPAWAPPAWLFGPMWSVLYILMAVSSWLVWRDHGFTGAALGLGLFVVQLVANALWSWLFFVLRRGALSVAEIVVLWLLILATILAFWPLHRFAALLLVPYLAWVSVASALTLSLWRANRAVLG